MKCAVHTEVDAAGYCRNCGKALCDACQRGVQGVLYCEGCLAALVTRPAVVVPPSGGNPALAAILGVIPGVGAIYNGEYLKAFIHLAIFAGTIAILNSGDIGGWEPLFGFFLAAFIIYMPIEAYRTAKAKMLGLPRTGPLDNLGENQPVGAYVLISIGALILLNNFGLLRIGQVLYYGFPLILILLGVWMLRKRMQPPAKEDKHNG